MIIPEGLTVNIGRREYRSGDTLPDNAPESVKKLVSDRIAALGKKGGKNNKTESGVKEEPKRGESYPPNTDGG